jgi:hypothetical protein
MNPAIFITVELTGWILNLLMAGWLWLRDDSRLRDVRWREVLLVFACAAFSWPMTIPLFVYLYVLRQNSARVVLWMARGIILCLVILLMVFVRSAIGDWAAGHRPGQMSVPHSGHWGSNSPLASGVARRS